MSKFDRRIIILTALCLFIGKSYCMFDADELKLLEDENNPIRKEFENHTETCFKAFKSSMVKLAVLFLDPGSDANANRQESKCWVKCMLEQFQFMRPVPDSNARGQEDIDKEKMLEMTSALSHTTRSKLTMFLTECDTQTKGVGEICNKAFSFVKCMFDMYRGRDLVPVVPVIPTSQPVVTMAG